MLIARTRVAVMRALFALMIVPAPVAAGGCVLIATDSGGSPVGLQIGDPVGIEGFNFALGEVVLVMSVDGVELRTTTVTAADAFGNTGHFIMELTPQTGEDGLWSVVATEAEGACSASTGFPVAAAPAPAPSDSPVIPDVAIVSARTPPSLASLLGVALVLLSAVSVGRLTGRWRRH